MIEPTQDDIGREVIYTHRNEFGARESGFITSFNDSFVFVKYGPGCTSAATKREDLEYAFPT